MHKTEVDNSQPLNVKQEGGNGVPPTLKSVGIPPTILCQEYGWDCLALEIMPDHIHLFVGAKPNWNPSKIVNLLKGNTSRQLRQCFPELKYLGYRYHIKQFKSLWAKGYYCGTAGHVSQEQVIRYILEQESEKTPFNYHTRKPSANGEKQSVPARAINQNGTATSENTQQSLGGWLN